MPSVARSSTVTCTTCCACSNTLTKRSQSERHPTEMVFFVTTCCLLKYSPTDRLPCLPSRPFIARKSPHTDAAPDVLMTIGPVAQDSTFVSQGVPGSSSALITYSGDAFMSSSGLRQACAFNLGGLIGGRNDRLEFLCEVARSFVPRCRPSMLGYHIRTRHALGCRIRVPSLSQCVRANLYA